MRIRSKFHTCIVFIGFVYLWHDLGVDCGLEETSKYALSSLNSDISRKLASPKVNLDINQTKELLKMIINSPDKELFTKERATELIQVSEIVITRCVEKTLTNIYRLISATAAFPNIQNYLGHYKSEYLKKCPDSIYERKSSLRFLTVKELESLDKGELSPIEHPPRSVERSAETLVDVKKSSDCTGGWMSRLIPKCFHA